MRGVARMGSGRPDYRELLFNVAGRLLGFCDRSRYSPTYGCFDRTYWCYRTRVDTPSPAYQTAVLPLAVVWSLEFPGNFYFHSEHLRQWIMAALRFWARCQHRDGSVDEWYANERSYCATAFTLFAVAEAVHRIGGAEVLDGEVVRAVQRSAWWLARAGNPDVANQEAAAAAALDSVRRLGIWEGSEAAAGETLRRLLGRQHAEGWFPEYGGADIGYSFLTLDLLEHLRRYRENSGLAEVCNRLLDFVQDFVAPDGTIAASVGSRDTAHLFPYGLELKARAGCGTAQSLLRRLAATITRGLGPSLLTVDDKYFAYFYSWSYALAAEVAVEADSVAPVMAEASSETRRAQWRPGSGLLSYRCGAVWAAASTQKGGAVVVYVDNLPFLEDWGAAVVEKDGSGYAGADPTESIGRCQIDETAVVLEITGALRRRPNFEKLRSLFPVFLVLTRSVFRSGRVGVLFKNFVKRFGIRGWKAGPKQYARWIRISEDRIVIEDRVGINQGFETVSQSSPWVYSPSARFFRQPEFYGLNAMPGRESRSAEGRRVRSWVLPFAGKGH